MNSKTQDQHEPSIHRLLDIVVEEVSLVDRAANKHRFLIVKRSDEMDEEMSPARPEDEDSAADTAKAHEQMPSWDNARLDSGAVAAAQDEGLAIAVRALQMLTNAVEQLGVADGAAGIRLGELAAGLHAIASQLDALAGDSAEADGETDEAQGALLGDTEEVLATSKRADGARLRATPGADSAKRSHPTGATPEETTIGKQLALLVDAIRSLTVTVTAQQQRLGKLEKSFGMPNSKPPGEHPRREDTSEGGWPLDLNKPYDRASVDKSVSFHDV